jgi:lipopolysaccharide export system permease protein
MLIFILQSVWLYIKELAGKDLAISVIFKFLTYVTPTLIPLIIPLTILLTSIMVFGSFAENYEFAAMKSTGISLQRAMSGLSIFIVALALFVFFIANSIIPWANFNFYNLRKNIAKVQPAMAIAEGQFNEIETYNIKVEEKSGDKGQYLKDVIIHIKQDNTVIKAKSGELLSDEKSDVLKLNLYDGNYYKDIKTNNSRSRQKHPFAKSKFEKYTINIDLSQMNGEVDIDDKSYTNRYNMLNIKDLDYTIDSLSKKQHEEQKDFSLKLLSRTGITTLRRNHKEEATDSIFTGKIIDLFDTSQKVTILNEALNGVRATPSILTTQKATKKISTILLNRHIISLHEKLALGFACIILFFVGAPLGALIRKGGLGLPMVIAILLFLTYHFMGIFATNSSKDGTLNPVFATWFATLVMLPLGVFLTRRATADKGLFEVGNIIEPIKKALNIKANEEAPDYSDFHRFKQEKLIDIIKNYSAYDYEEGSKYEAIKTLYDRGKTFEDLLSEGIVFNKDYKKTQTIASNYFDHSKLASVLYGIGAILLVLFFILRNNKMPSLASASIQLSLVSFALYIIYYIKTFLNLSSFYKHVRENSKFPNVFTFTIGFPLYMITYVFINSKVKEDQKQHCLDSLKETNIAYKTANIKTSKVSEEVKIEKNDLSEASVKMANHFVEHSKFAIILYSVGTILLVLFFVFKNNKLPSLESASIQLSITAFVLYTIYFIKSSLNLISLYKEIKEELPSIWHLLIGFLFYMITYPLLITKIKNYLK